MRLNGVKQWQNASRYKQAENRDVLSSMTGHQLSALENDT